MTRAIQDMYGFIVAMGFSQDKLAKLPCHEDVRDLGLGWVRRVLYGHECRRSGDEAISRA